MPSANINKQNVSFSHILPYNSYLMYSIQLLAFVMIAINLACALIFAAKMIDLDKCGELLFSFFV